MKNQDTLTDQERNEIETILDAVKTRNDTVKLDSELCTSILSKAIPGWPNSASGTQDLFNLFTLLLSSQIINKYHAKSEQKKLTGILGVVCKYLDSTYQGCSRKETLDAFKDPNFLDRLYDHLLDYSQATGIELRILKSDLGKRLVQLAAVSDSSILRYFNLAEEEICRLLGTYRAQLAHIVSADGSTKKVSTVSLTTPVPSEGNDQDFVSLLLGYSAKWMQAPSAFGFSLPIDRCVEREFQADNERHTISARYLANHYLGTCGTISGLPCGGRTTAGLIAAYYGNQQMNQDRYIFYLSLKDFVDYAEKGRDCAYYVASQLSRKDDHSDITALRDQVVDLNGRQKLLILCDDFERLTNKQQSLVLSRLSTMTSIYYVGSPWRVAEIRRELLKHNPPSSVKALRLVDLDMHHRELLASCASDYLGIPNVNGRIFTFAEQFPSEGILPVEVIAIALLDRPDDFFAYTQSIFTEMLRRDGHSSIRLPKMVSDLNPVMMHYLSLGRAVRDSLKKGSGQPLGMVDDHWSTTIISVDVLDTIAGTAAIALLCSGLVRYDGRSKLRLINRRMEIYLVALDMYYSGDYEVSFWRWLWLWVFGDILGESRAVATSLSNVLE